MRADLAVLKSNENFSATFTTSVSGDITMSYGDFASETSNTPSHTYALLPPYLLNVKKLSVPHSTITGIDLSTNNLTAVDVSRFKNLTTLDVSNNLLTLKEISKILIELDSMGQENGTLTSTGNISGSITSEASIALTNLLSKGWVSDEYYGQWSPEVITTTAWYDASDTITLTLGISGVSQWDDKSSNGYDVIQGDGSLQPSSDTYTAPNSLEMVKSDGTEYLSTNVVFPANGVFSIFMVGDWISPNDGNSANSFYGVRNGDLFHRQDSNTDNKPRMQLSQVDSDINNLTSGTNYNDLFQSYYKHDYSNDTMSFYINGDLVIEKTTPSPPINNPIQGSEEFVLFANKTSNPKIIDGAVGEILIVPDVTDATRQKIEGYLAHKWGLESNLPIAHPYKTSAP